MQNDLNCLEGQLASLDSDLGQRDAQAAQLHRQLAAVRERLARRGSLPQNAGALLFLKLAPACRAALCVACCRCLVLRSQDRQRRSSARPGCTAPPGSPRGCAGAMGLQQQVKPRVNGTHLSGLSEARAKSSVPEGVLFEAADVEVSTGSRKDRANPGWSLCISSCAQHAAHVIAWLIPCGAGVLLTAGVLGVVNFATRIFQTPKRKSGKPNERA